MQKLQKTLKYSAALCLGIYTQNKIINYQMTEPSQPISQEFLSLIKEKDLFQPLGYLNYRQYSQSSYIENILHSQLSAFSLYGIYCKQPISNKISSFLDLDDKDKDSCEMYCFIKANPQSALQQPSGKLHNGLPNAIMDSLMAQLSAISSDYSPVATAYIDHNYLKPLSVNQEYIIIMKINKKDKRKIFVSADVYDKEMTCHFHSDGLFLKVSWAGKQWEYLRSLLQLKSSVMG